jgi:hypothetical protein
VLGFPIAREADFRPGARWIELSIPGTKTNIHAGDVVREHAARRSEWRRTTKRECGLETSAVQSAPWGRYLTFSDPDGNGWIMNEAR